MGNLDLDKGHVCDAPRFGDGLVGHPDRLGRSGSRRENSAGAAFASLTNCRRKGIDAREYLEDVLTRLPGMTNQHNIKPLTPAGGLQTKRGKMACQAA